MLAGPSSCRLVIEGRIPAVSICFPLTLPYLIQAGQCEKYQQIQYIGSAVNRGTLGKEEATRAGLV